MIPLGIRAFKVVNLPHTTRGRLGQGFLPPAMIPSPFTGMLIPVFSVTLSHRGRSRKADIGFDSGMNGAHLEMPTELADELGITAVSEQTAIDASGEHKVFKGRIDRISIPGQPNCAVDGATVIFFDDAPTLIGNDFIDDIGASISYGANGPRLTCSGSTQGQTRRLPKFPISIIHRGEVIPVEALFDTGWDGAEIAMPTALVERLRLPVVGSQKVRTHTQTLTIKQARADRIALRDLPGCHADEVLVDIMPKGSPFDMLNQVIVGEPFLKRTNGVVGYDSDGAFFSCAAHEGRKARAIKIEEIPVPLTYEPIYILEEAGLWLLVGGLAAAGLVGYFIFGR